MLDLDNSAKDVLIQRNMDEGFRKTLKYIRDLIPDEFIVVQDNLLSGVDGSTLYSGKIVLRQGLVEGVENSLILAEAKYMITVFHKVSHMKRAKNGPNSYFFMDTPETIANENVDGEAGNCMEEFLFGGCLDLKHLTEAEAESIIDLDNFLDLQRFRELNQTLHPFVKAKPSGYDFRRQSEESNEGCFMQRVRSLRIALI